MCYNPSLVRDKPLEAPAFVKLLYFHVPARTLTQQRCPCEIKIRLIHLDQRKGYVTNIYCKLNPKFRKYPINNSNLGGITISENGMKPLR